MDSTFSLNQSSYSDLKHDVNIASVIIALGLTQVNQSFTANGPSANQQMIVSHMEPVGSILVEIIETPQPVKVTRPAANNATTHRTMTLAT